MATRVILQDNVQHLGKTGDIVKVKGLWDLSYMVDSQIAKWKTLLWDDIKPASLEEEERGVDVDGARATEAHHHRLRVHAALPRDKVESGHHVLAAERDRLLGVDDGRGLEAGEALDEAADGRHACGAAHEEHLRYGHSLEGAVEARAAAGARPPRARRS